MSKHLFTGNPYPSHTLHLPNVGESAQFVRGEYETESDLERDDLLWCIERGYLTASYVSKETRAEEAKAKKERDAAVRRAEARKAASQEAA
jgi:hypothetical protein